MGQAHCTHATTLPRTQSHKHGLCMSPNLSPPLSPSTTHHIMAPSLNSDSSSSPSRSLAACAAASLSLLSLPHPPVPTKEAWRRAAEKSDKAWIDATMEGARGRGHQGGDVQHRGHQRHGHHWPGAMSTLDLSAALRATCHAYARPSMSILTL
jgi:hypothetical protein